MKDVKLKPNVLNKQTVDVISCNASFQKANTSQNNLRTCGIVIIHHAVWERIVMSLHIIRMISLIRIMMMNEVAVKLLIFVMKKCNI